MRYLLLVWAAFTTLGCKDSNRRYVSSGSPAPVTTSTQSVSWRDQFPDVPTVPPGHWEGDIWIPDWLENHWPVLKQEALDEIASTAVELDPRYNVVPSGITGPPSGWKVIIMDAGSFSMPASPTGLAAGYVDVYRRHIYVAWRPISRNPKKLPALGHELGHAWCFVYTQDVVLTGMYGH